ncbi:unnamed protein product, partial [Chrysoparadoxa australica]
QTLLRRSGDLTREEVSGLKGKDINWVEFKTVHPEVPSDREIVVAVLDSGVDIGHPDLKDRIFFDKKLCPNASDIDDKPCQGINVLKKNSDVSDDVGHGTHVAGIISAIADNKLGVAGLTDPRVKILPIKVISKDTNDFIYNNRLMTDIFADGIIFAIQRGAKVINISMGWPKVIETPKIKNALKHAADNDVVIVAASGNNNKQIPLFPCTNENVICVGAADNQGKITEFTNFGGKVDILAPGESIVSTYPREEVESRILRIRGYESIKGSSQASPFVAGIAASLKLIDPDMSIDEIKARLFASARRAEDSFSAGKFTKYGLVDMKAALTKKPESFITPEYKDLLDLNYNVADGSFFFGLPVKSYIGTFEDVEVEATFDRDDISLENSVQKVSLKEGQIRSLLFKGKLLDLKADTHFLLNVKIKKGEEVLSNTQTTLIFARELSRERNLKKDLIDGFTAQELTFFKGVRKALRTSKVEDPESLNEKPTFYVQTAAAQTETNTVLDLLLFKDGKWTKDTLSLEKKHEVITIAYRDLNLDGNRDIYVVAVNKDQDRVTFEYFLKNEKGEKLKDLAFNFPLLEYERFPLDYKELGKTEMRTIKQKDGSLLKVPSFYTVYTMPELDNTQDILDRMPEDLRLPHLYFMEPARKNGEDIFRLRVIDSLNVLEDFRMENMIESWMPLGLDRPFAASYQDQKKGQLRGLLTAGEEFMRQYYLYLVNENGVSFQQVFFPDNLVAGNSIRPMLSLESGKLGLKENKVEFLAQLQRSQVRSYIWNLENLEGSSLILDTQNYGDPIFNAISTFNDEDQTRFIETRYFLEFHQKNGVKKGLRINRESSFPGVRFSETLDTIAVKGEEKNYPGIFINSTLIFGNRLYSMVKKDDDFVRPLEFSVDIPSNCVHMDPEKIDGVYQYLMLCRESGGKISLLSLPLELK